MKYSGIVNRFIAIVVIMIISTVAQQQIFAAECPCDIYATAGTPCIAAYSTARLLYSTYVGPLYQVRRTSDNQTKDIGLLSGTTVADGAAQDSFLSSGAGTISKLYDQSGKGNVLTVAKKGSYTGTAASDDKEANAKGKSFMINGHKAYALYVDPAQGYRSRQEGYTGYPASVQPATGMPTGNQAEGIYAVEDGSRANVGNACCFDFGNASLNNAADGTGGMNTLFFGTAYWGKGANNGPWFMNDMEAGVWAGGSKDGDPGWGALSGTHTANSKLPSSTWDFAFGLTKTNTTTAPQYSIRVAVATVNNGAVPALQTAYDGQAPSTWKQPGGIVLGVGGDNSNSSNGTFYEGCITAGRPSDATDSLILRNISNARYGSTTPSVIFSAKEASANSLFKVSYNPSSASAVISYTLQDTRRVSVNIVDQKGRRIAEILNAVKPAGPHETVWNAKQVPAGVYICKVAIEGLEKWTEKVIIQK